MARVSIIMAAYNQRLFIRDSVMSILNQTFKDYELIIVNDGSTDETEAILNEFSDGRIKIYNNVQNRGLIYSLNKGISFANKDSEFIARMDSDDIAESTRIQKQVNFLEGNKEIGLVGTAMKYFGDLDTSRHYLENDQDIKSMFLFTNPISHPTVMLRADLMPFLKYDTGFPGYEDYALWISLINKTKFHNLNEELLLYRRHNSNVTNSNKQDVEKDHRIYKELLIRYSKVMGFTFSNSELNIMSIIASRPRFSLMPHLSLRELTLFGKEFLNKLPVNLKNNRNLKIALKTRIVVYLIGTKKYGQVIKFSLLNLGGLKSIFAMYKFNQSPVK